MSTYCLLRCNGFGPVEKGLVAQLRRWFEDRIIAVTDERHRSIDTGTLPKLALNDEVIEGMGLYAHRAWPWRCGDYALIAARAALPDASRFWIVEPDVYFATRDVSQIFAPLDMTDVDLISPVFQRSEEEWAWADRMAQHLQPVYRCHFPLIRASARLIDAVAEQRRAMTDAPGALPEQCWPNDEAVVATVAFANNMRAATIAELSEDPAVTENFSYRANRIWRLSHLRSAHPDGGIYHPAYPERRFVEHLEHMADDEPDRLDAYLERLGDCISAEEVMALLDRAAFSTKAQGVVA